jgi:carbonic anhydrase/acetyltransferase-like protein (isoleucine patch superfamily)
MSQPFTLQAFGDLVPALGQDVYVHPAATVIGDVVLGDHVSIWPGTVIRGDVNHILIGAGTNVQDGSVLHVSHRSTTDPDGAPLQVGANVTIGHKVILHGCSIGDECLIGMGCIVMDHVEIGKHVLLGAGSLVPEGRRLDSGHLYLGSPARKVRRLSEKELVHFIYSAQHYIALKDVYLRQAAKA